MSEYNPQHERPPITEEDLNLLATPSDELLKRTQVFSFDEEKCEERIINGDQWQKLLLAHLYFDHVISQLLRESLANPNIIKVNRMSFHQKLQLSLALGLIPEDISHTIEFINGLRNKIAHDLNFELREKDEMDLANCTPKWLRGVLAEGGVRKKKSLDFGEMLHGILLHVEIIRQKHAFDRLNARKSAIHLRTVLDKTEGVIYKP